MRPKNRRDTNRRRRRPTANSRCRRPPKECASMRSEREGSIPEAASLSRRRRRRRKFSLRPKNARTPGLLVRYWHEKRKTDEKLRSCTCKRVRKKSGVFFFSSEEDLHFPYPRGKITPPYRKPRIFVVVFNAAQGYTLSALWQ